MKRSLQALALALLLCGTASANTYSIGLNLTRAEFVVGTFSDQVIFSAVGSNPVSINVSQIISFSAGGSGRGGGYKRGTRRYISLSSAAVYDSTGVLLGVLAGTSTSLAGTFSLPAGTYAIMITGTGTGTKGSGEYGVMVQQTPPPPPPVPPAPRDDDSD